jgi:hypothetical protein
MALALEQKEQWIDGGYRLGNNFVKDFEAHVLSHVWTGTAYQANYLCQSYYGEFNPQVSTILTSTVNDLNMAVAIPSGKVISTWYPNKSREPHPKRTYYLDEVSEEHREAVRARFFENQARNKGYEIAEGVIINGSVGLALEYFDNHPGGTIERALFHRFLYPLSRDMEVDKWVEQDLRKARSLIAKYRGRQIGLSNGIYIIPQIEQVSLPNQSPITPKEDREKNMPIELFVPKNKRERGIVASQVLYLMDAQNIKEEGLETVMFEQLHHWILDNMSVVGLVVKDFEEYKDQIIGVAINLANDTPAELMPFKAQLLKFLQQNPHFWDSENGVINGKFVEELFNRWHKRGRTFRKIEDQNLASARENQRKLVVESQIKALIDEIRNYESYIRGVKKDLKGLRITEGINDAKINGIPQKYGSREKIVTQDLKANGVIVEEKDQDGNARGRFTYSSAVFVAFICKYPKLRKVVLENKEGFHALIDQVELQS